ncbi:MAG: S24 family peptidase [Thermodesulfobacteriota bacterium]|nr:S24 family peptidase [Thermodesulfobacteriota bacterium]
MSSKKVQYVDPRKTYSGPGSGAAKIIARMKESLGFHTQSALAEELGVRRAAVSDAKRQNRIPAEWLLKLCRGRGLNPNWLETGQGDAFIRPAAVREARDGYGAGSPEGYDFVPMAEAGFAAHGGGLETQPRVLASYAFRTEWLLRKGRIESMRLVRVTGESMEPTLEDNDMVLVDLSRTDILVGRIYAVRMDNEIVVKRLEKKPGKLMLVSDNRALYEPLEIDLGKYVNVEVLGRVVWMSREMA